MQYVINGYQPEAFFRFFEDISSVPRGSGNEKGIMEFLVNFAKERGLWCHTDDVFNVIIKKPGSAGYENAPAIILQGHTDIVCEKNNDVVHDFEKDPLKLYVEDGVLRARGTTLGADNGTAVAYMMALLDADDLAHPPLECVFTSQEEVGLIGAKALDMSLLTGKVLVNMDSGRLGNTVAGCAGGVMMHLTKPITYEKAAGHALEVTVSGLRGGHSAGAIDVSRGNPMKIIGQITDGILGICPAMQIASIEGGAQTNAIPREVVGVFLFEDKAEIAEATAFLKELETALKDQYGTNDPDLAIAAKEIALPENSFGAALTKELNEFINIAPHGVVFRNKALNDTLIASVNFASMHDVGGAIRTSFLPRSSEPVIKTQMRRNVELLAQAYGFTVDAQGDFPAWRYSETSVARDVFNEVSQEILGEDAVVQSTHGGLECGIFADAIPGLDILAIGPNADGAHTPQECLYLDSCETQWKILTLLLEKFAKRG